MWLNVQLKCFQQDFVGPDLLEVKVTILLSGTIKDCMVVRYFRECRFTLHNEICEVAHESSDIHCSFRAS